MSIKQLERQLGITKSTGSSADRYAAEVSSAMLAEIKEAKRCQEEAEKETAKLRAEVSGLKDELQNRADAAAQKMHDMYSEHTKEMQQMRAIVAQVQKDMASGMSRMQGELATECEARARLEVQVKAATDTHAQLERIVKSFNIALPAPVVNNVAPAVTASKGAKAEVTQRDQNGRIVSISITPVEN